MTTKILRNLGIFFIFLVPFIPLYISYNFFFPFISGKAFAFRIIVEVIFVLWLVLMLREKSYYPKFSWLSLAVTAFAVVVLVADLTGLNPLRSLWSNFERMEGWVTVIHLWAYFMAVTGIFGIDESRKKMWHYFFNTTIFAAIIVGFYGLFQVFGWTAIHQGSSRIDASLGNAIYMAVYMLMHAFIALYMSFAERAKKRTGLSWFYIILALFFSFLLFETATRGTIIGLVGGIALALGIYAVFGRKQSAKSRLASGGIIVAMILLVLLFYANKDASFIKKNETLNRLASISLSDTRTQARGFIWPMAVKSAFQSPKTAIIGIGQENFNYIFNADYDPQMWRHEQWFDRAHNVYLDWLVAGGLSALILYLSLFLIALVTLWKSPNINFVEKCIFTGLLAGYAVHNIFVFDNLISYILFFTVLGFIHSMKAVKPVALPVVKDSQDRQKAENQLIVRDYVYVPVIIVLFAAALYFVNVRVIQANTRLITAYSLCANRSPSYVEYVKALELDQYLANQEIREQLLSCASSVTGGDFPSTVKTDFYNLAKKEIEEQIKATPNDARAYVLGGAFFNYLNDWNSARPLLEKASQLSPGKQTIVFELATNYMNTGKEKEALEIIEKAYESAPDNNTSKIAYLSLLILTGDEKKARELFGNEPELFVDERVIAVYAKLKQYPKIIEIYKKLIEKEPKNMQYRAGLAGTYFNNNQKDLSIAELKKMAVDFTEFKSQLDEAIKAIQEGKDPFGQQ